MWLEAVTVVVCGIGLAAVVMTVLAALVGIIEPATFTRCHDCSRWMINLHSGQTPVCFRCRQVHHGHALWAHTRLRAHP